MSALGQKQTFAAQNAMSALPPKADMCGAVGDVRFVPKADIALLFNQLVCAPDYRVGDVEAERLGGLEVYNQLNFRRLRNWQVGRLLTLENSPGINPDAGDSYPFHWLHSPSGRRPATNGRYWKIVGTAWRSASAASCSTCARKNNWGR